MPQITGTVTEDSKSRYTEYTGTATTSSQTFTFSDEQDGMTFRNKSAAVITLTLGDKTYSVPPKATIEIDDVSFASFDAQATAEATFELKAFYANTPIRKQIGIWSEKLDGVSSQLAERALQIDLDTTNTTLSTKVAKGEDNQVTLSMLTQEVRTEMTGGSVAVVGESSVSLDQITVEVAGYLYDKGKTNLFDKKKITKGYFMDSLGVITATASDLGYSEYIPVLSSQGYFFYDGEPPVNNAVVYVTQFDANKVCLGTSATEHQYAKNILTKSNCAFIVVTISNTVLNTFQVIKGGAAPAVYTSYYTKKTPTLDWYYGKKLTTFGDSITEQGKWQSFLLSKFGFLTHTNRGVGGTKVIDDGSGTGFCTDARVNNIPSDSDVIIIMGGTNDEGQSIPLGDLTFPYDTSKFKGALATTIKKIETRCPNALIIVMSLVGGRGSTSGVNDDTPKINTLGLWSKDYAEATKEVCEYLGKPYVPLFESSGINFYNRATYISDTVHPNDAGGKKMGIVAVNGLKRYEPIA